MVNGSTFIGDGYAQLLGIFRTHDEKKLRSYLIGGHGQFFLCMFSISCEEKNVGIAKNLVHPTAE